jgi:hypothetical protein
VYAESLILDREVAIAGACAGRTRVTLSSSTSTTAFEVIARNVSLRGLSIAGGVRVRGEASLEDLVLERLEVRGRTRLTEALLRRPPDSGIAVMVRDGGALEMERVVVDSGIEGFPFANIQCTGADSSLVATDLIVAGGGKGVEALFGCMLALEGGRFTGSLLSAVEVSAGARATVRTVWMEKCWGAGIRVLDDQEGAEALVEDVAIEGTETAPGLAEELLPGFGIQVWGGKLSGARVYLASNRGPAIHLEDGTIALEDVVARNNGPGFEQTYPTVAAQYHGTLTLTRAEVRGAAGAAVHAASGAELRLSELTIADPGGPGIYTSSYGALTLERVSISGATDFGVKLELNPLRFDGRGISIRDLTVRDTRGDRGAGMSLDGALAISMSRFLIERNGASGVWVVGSGDSGDSGDLHIAGGVVRGHSVGLIADPLAPKTSRLIEGVHLDANDTAIAR